MTTEQVIAMALEVGFDHVGEIDPKDLKFLPEVRDMCSANRCHSYNKSWACPPACGTLEEITERARQYRRGIVIQSTGQMEDDFDVECMMETEKLQKKRFFEIIKLLQKEFPNCLGMSAGTCTLCPKCAYPDEPCRHPELMFPSMEAYGLLVSDACTSAGLEYYYGKNTMTYTSCILLD